MKLLRIALLCSAGLMAGQAMACYVVYDKVNRIVYNSPTPPVDMSKPISQTLPHLYPGGHMVFSGTTCSNDEPLVQPKVAATSTNGTSPLLTDRRTAEAMNVPHTVLPSGAALVANRPAGMSAGMMVADSGIRSRDTVITEMHNPPLTAVQVGGAVISAVSNR